MRIRNALRRVIIRAYSLLPNKGIGNALEMVFGDLLRIIFGEAMNVNGQKMICTCDHFPSFANLITGEVFPHDEPAFSLFKYLLKKNMIVVDVGAGTGLFTLTACKRVGAKGKVFSFEQDQITFLILKENIKLNHYRNVKAFNLAIRGEQELNSFVKIADLIVIDVEGDELDVLKGMSCLMEKNPKIVCEIHPQRNSDQRHKEIYDLFHNYGFNLFFAGLNSSGFRKEGVNKKNIYYIFATKDDSVF